MCNDKYCYIGSGNGKIYQYDIEMCKSEKKFDIGDNMNIIDMAIDTNFLFLACEQGNIVIIELSLEFEIARMNIINDNKQKCWNLFS